MDISDVTRGVYGFLKFLSKNYRLGICFRMRKLRLILENNESHLQTSSTFSGYSTRVLCALFVPPVFESNTSGSGCRSEEKISIGKKPAISLGKATASLRESSRIVSGSSARVENRIYSPPFYSYVYTRVNGRRRVNRAAAEKKNSLRICDLLDHRVHPL